MKVWLIISQTVTFVSWVYIRISRPPIEGFIAGNFLMLGHLMVIIGILGWRFTEFTTFVSLCLIGLPFILNLIRYYPEFKLDGANIPRNGGPFVSRAGFFIQRSVDVAAVVGAIAVLIFTLMQRDLIFENLVFLAFAFAPGLGCVMGLLADFFHRRRSQ